MDVIRARGLGKRYGELDAVDGIDFEARPGERFGFLGPNGAGKSTTMRMLYCAVAPDRGSLDILGLDARDPGNRRAIKRRLGVVPQEESLDQDLTLRENLHGFALFHGLGGAEARRRV
ncbi:MAG: ATP-binding cassette domain-containing protein, partial [Planctomycetota bacterium]